MYENRTSLISKLFININNKKNVDILKEFETSDGEKMKKEKEILLDLKFSDKVTYVCPVRKMGTPLLSIVRHLSYLWETYVYITFPFINVIYNINISYVILPYRLDNDSSLNVTILFAVNL